MKNREVTKRVCEFCRDLNSLFIENKDSFIEMDNLEEFEDILDFYNTTILKIGIFEKDCTFNMMKNTLKYMDEFLTNKETLVYDGKIANGCREYYVIFNSFHDLFAEFYFDCVQLGC